MQDKIKSDFDEKLKNYVTMPVFMEADGEAKAVARRVGHNEGTLKDV